MIVQYIIAFCAPLIVGGIWTAVVILKDIRKILRERPTPERKTNV